MKKTCQSPKLESLLLFYLLFFFQTSVFYTKGQSLQILNFSLQSISLGLPIQQVINKNKEIPLSISKAVSGISIDADVTLNGELSYVRIVLIDSNSIEYLLYETNALLASEKTFSVKNICEETCALDKVHPKSLRIELENTEIVLKQINISYPSALKLMPLQINDKFKHEQLNDKINQINAQIKRKGLHWVAGETSIAKMSYAQKKALFGGKLPNLYGFEYYKEGIFVLPSSDTTNKPVLKSTDSSSPYISEFNWRNRHGQDWSTPVKDQGGCGSCWAFSTTAAAEQLVNLYYNRHLNLDLSEQYIVSCSGAGSCSTGGYPGQALDFMASTGIVNESCFQYTATDQACSNSCTVPQERIKIGGRGSSYWRDDDQIKDEIISGPVSASIFSWSHAMNLLGYKVINAGDQLYLSGNLVTKAPDDPLVGCTAWYFKNSWGINWGDGGYSYLVTNNNNFGIDPLNGPVTSTVHSTADVRCVDADGDGYYTWGLGVKPPQCPPCPDLPDGDDSNLLIGPIDRYGYPIVPITNVILNKDTLSLKVGEFDTLFVTILPANANPKNVYWYTNNFDVARVDQNGLVEAVAPGTATIYAGAGGQGKIDSCIVTVTPAPYLIYDFETYHDLTGWTEWGNAFEGVCTDTAGWWGKFNQQGKYHLWGYKNGGDIKMGSMNSRTFKLGGNGIITFLLGGGSDINNLYIALMRVSDGAELMRMTADNNEAYTARQFNATAYIGQDLYIRLVDFNTASFGHLNLDNLRIPTGMVAVTGVTLDKSTLTKFQGETEQLVATVSPADATNKNVTWSSSDVSIANVDQSGVVNAIAPGTATITVTTQDGTKTATCVISVIAMQFLVYDFETNHDLTGWTVTGNAFTNAGVCTDTSGWWGAFNQQGHYHFWGYKATGDAPTGQMSTNTFTLAGNGIITFLLGGGSDINNLYIAVVRASDNTELMKMTAGNNEAYTLQQFDASAYLGQNLYIKLVDNATGGFGHLNLDNLRIPYSAMKSADAGTTRNENYDEIKLYPNPADKQIIISLSAPVMQAAIEIIDVTGVVVYKTNIINSDFVIIPIEELKSGIYFLKVANNSIRIVKKMIKQ